MPRYDKYYRGISKQCKHNRYSAPRYFQTTLQVARSAQYNRAKRSTDLTAIVLCLLADRKHIQDVRILEWPVSFDNLDCCINRISTHIP